MNAQSIPFPVNYNSKCYISKTLTSCEHITIICNLNFASKQVASKMQYYSLLALLVFCLIGPAFAQNEVEKDEPIIGTCMHASLGADPYLRGGGREGSGISRALKTRVITSCNTSRKARVTG